MNRGDPRECYVVFSESGYIPEILKLLDDPQWVGKHMHLTLQRPKKEILPIVAKLLGGQPLDKGEEFEYFPVEQDLEGAEGPPTSTPKKGEDPVIPELVKHFKSLQTNELRQIMAALSREMDARHVPRDIPPKPDGFGTTPQDVSSILHSLIKEGALRTNIPKLSIFSGERVKGEASFEQWSYELQSLRRTYSESALREGIQRSLRGAAADTVCNMGPEATLDSIIKKFSIIYGNVKSYDILMGDFYHASQGEEESVTSFATCIEGLLSNVRDKYPQQIPQAKEQQLLKDRLFHGCQKGIRDSVKYRHADTTVDYMTFLEECRKAEDEDGVGKSRPKGKVKVAAATTSTPSPSTYNDAFSRQLRKQQQQFDTLMSKVQAMVTTLQSHNAQAASTFKKGGPSIGMRGKGRMPFTSTGGRGVPGGGGPPPPNRWRGQPQPQGPNSHQTLPHPQQEQGNSKTYTESQCWQCGEVGHLKRSCLPAKRQGAVTRGECLNSPTSSSHSPTISKSTNMVGKEMARSKTSSKFLNPDPWARLIGRANEEKIKINGHTVTALLDTGSQVTHISLDYCQAMGIPINPIEQLVNIEGAGGDAIKYVGFIEADLIFPMGTHVFKTEALLLVLPTTEYQKRVPVTIGTSLTDMAVDSLGLFDTAKLSPSWKTVCFATQTRRQIQAQQIQKQTVKTTKPTTLPPFSTTVVHGHTKLKGHGLKLNLIAEPSKNSQLPSNIQCTPTYCTLEPGSN